MTAADEPRYEVEQKFRVAAHDSVQQALQRRGARFAPPVVQIDCYYRHPLRDFAATDEAFRLRTVGEANLLTYKGPKIDAATKTRQEIEFAIDSGPKAARACRDLLAALGFSPAGEVQKTRTAAVLPQGGDDIHIALDHVHGLGDFVELELTATADQLDHARGRIAELAAELGLIHNERRSYLELLARGQ